eukprot:IDg23139t1
MSASFYSDLAAQPFDEPADGQNYQNMIRSLLFLANQTRPDTATSVGILSLFVSKPTKQLLKCCQRVFGYLKGTASYGLVQRKKSTLNIEVFCDSDFAGERQERKSRTGWVILVNDVAVSWASHKQTCTALSTAEAEYVAMSECAQEIKSYVF